MNARPANIFPWFLLAGSLALCLYTPLSLWAINAESLGKYNLGIALFFSFTLPLAIYIAGAITIISGTLAVFYSRANRRGRHILLSATVTGVLPFLYLWVLDAISSPVS
ncbi:MAG TPA: hypothetical protein VET88_00800 [Gammaproteobacteria bacterium]|nr:hypothetical protein [Gammaproteobacteria bacterium]